mgnify:FL=1
MAILDLNKLYSKNGELPNYLPDRIRLSNGLTKTDRETFTQEDISQAGYVAVEEPPTTSFNQVSEWNSENLSWSIREKNASEIDEEWEKIKKNRDDLLKKVDMLVDRYKSVLSQGLPYNYYIIEALDEYAQQLRNITDQEDVFNIIWPNLDEIDHRHRVRIRDEEQLNN